MQITASHPLLADREQVWSVLLDPATPAHLLPGSGTAEVDGRTTTAHVVLRDGPVALDCDVVVSLRVVPGGHRLEVVVRTRGGVGRTESRASLRLVETEAGCRLESDVIVRVSGLLRLWGRRLLPAAVTAQVDAAVVRLGVLLPQAPTLRSVPTGPAALPPAAAA